MMGDELERLIRLIYGAVEDREGAASMFAALVSAVGASSGWVNDFSSIGVSPVVPGFNIDPAVDQPYRAHFHRDDPWPKLAYVVPPGKATSLERYLSTRDFQRSEMYNDLFRPMDIDILHNMSMRLDLPDGFRGVSFFRGSTRDPFGAAEERVLDIASLHLQHLFRIWDEAAPIAERFTAFASGRAPDAVFALDRRARLIDLNGAAAAILARGRLVRVLVDRALAWASADDQIAVDAVLAMIRRRKIGGRLLIHDRDGIPHHILIDAVPARSDAAGAAVLISIRDVARLIEAQVNAAVRAFHLSPSEAALAGSLLANRTIHEHARRRGVALETVRKQLAGLFHKSGASRQASLVALLFSLVG